MSESSSTAAAAPTESSSSVPVFTSLSCQRASSDEVASLSNSSTPSNFQRILSALHTYSLRAITSNLTRLHTHLLLSSTFYSRCYLRLRTLPITEFYLYMFRRSPRLFAHTMFVNYLLPILMEAMPWYLSRRKISRLLRESRNSITHRLVANEPFNDSAIGSFVLFSLIYAFVQTVEQVLRTRVLLANRLLIKRLVLERILYSELGSLQTRYYDVFGEDCRTEQLEQLVFNDISETLNLFNTTIPSLMRGTYTLIGSAHDLWLNRDAFDVLAIVRPSIVGMTSEAINYLREKMIVDVQTQQMQRNASAMSRVVTNIVDGLAEIQTNNMQRYQLLKLDQVSADELHTQQGVTTFVNNIYRQVSNRSVFDFASEVYVVRMVMQRRKINHETYRKVQNDIDYVTRLFGRLWSQLRDSVRVYDTQERVIALLNLPSFIQEAKGRDGGSTLESLDESVEVDAGVSAANSSSTAIAAASTISSPRISASSSSYLPVASSSLAAALSTSLPAPIVSFTDFRSLHIKRCVFRYKTGLPLALNIHQRLPGEKVRMDSDDDRKEEAEEKDGQTHASFGFNTSSTASSDLLAEIDHVLAHPRLPKSFLRSVSLTSSTTSTAVLSSTNSDATSFVAASPSHSIDEDGTLLPVHPASAVMSDIMQSRDSQEDDEGNVFAEASDEQVENGVTEKKEESPLKELEDHLRQTELRGDHLRFQDQPIQENISASAPSSTISAIVAPAPIPTPQLPSLVRESSVKSSSTPTLMSPTTLSRSLSLSSSTPSFTPVCEPGTLLFERGKSYALIGENRSGKSTLVQILCKLYQPAHDQCEIILNDSSDFTALPRMMLRDRVSYVAQRPFIFPGTIEENIRIGNTKATAEEVEKAAEMAGIFSMEQPKPLSLGAQSTRSLVDRTGMKIVAKPWEQNRLKNVLVAGAGWVRRQWLKIHGFHDVAQQDGEIEVDDDSDSDEQLEAELRKQEFEHTRKEIERAGGSTSSDATLPLSPSVLPVASSSSTAFVSSSTASTSISSSKPIHPTLLLETAERGANLSGGFAQSVALARVFLRSEAQIIILDEAMGQMDAIKKRELIFPRLFEFVRQRNMTLILISHDVPLVCKLVDTVYVMSHGECVQAGTHRQLMSERGGAYARLVGEEKEVESSEEVAL